MSSEDLCNFANELGHSGVLALGDLYSWADNNEYFQLRYSANSDQWAIIGRIAGRYKLSIQRNFDIKGLVRWMLENATSRTALSNFANELGLSGVCRPAPWCELSLSTALIFNSNDAVLDGEQHQADSTFDVQFNK